jgi:transcriptional repressor NrdR
MVVMRCPRCESASRVLESRSAENGASVRRRRECSSCGHRFTTYERSEQTLFVRKRNGHRQPFDRAKLRNGLARAAHKRPVAEAEIDAIVENVETAVTRGGELLTADIGELCLRGLREVDWGAYLQFAGTLPAATPEFALSDSDIGPGSIRSAREDAMLPAKAAVRRELDG